jgi:ABC-type branched-subunit amino acid transport system substrate-binding protein
MGSALAEKLLRLSLAFMVLSCTVFHAQSQERIIKIGYLLDLSGKAAFIGQQSRSGAELARTELTSQQPKLIMLYEDHQTDPKMAVTAAKKFLEIDKVDAILCDATPPCLAAAKVVADAKKLMLYQAPATSLLDINPYALKNYLDYEEGCRKVSEYFKKRGLTRVGQFKINYEFGELCLKGSQTVFPSQRVFPYNGGDDLRGLVARAKGESLQAVLQTGYEGDYMSRFSASSDIGFAPLSGMPQPLLSKAVVDRLGPTLNGTLVFGFPQVEQEFIDRLKAAKLFKDTTALESAVVGYLHVSLLYQALRDCGAGDADCQLKKLTSITPPKLMGFKGWKNRIAQYDLVLRRWANGVLKDIAEGSS